MTTWSQTPQVDFKAFAWAFVKNWADSILDALQDFSDAVVAMFSWDVLFRAWWSDPAGVFGPFLEALQNLANAIGLSASRSLLQTIVENFPPPKGWSYKVITLQNAYEEVIELICIDGRSVGSLQLPLGLRLVAYLKGRFKLFRILINPSVERVLGAVWARLFKISWLKIILAVLRVVFSTFNATVAVGLGMLAFFFVERCYADKFFVKRLGQSAPRLRVHPIEGGVIRRRAVGGSPP